MNQQRLRWGFFLMLAIGLLGCEDDPEFSKQYRPPRLDLKPRERLHVPKPSVTYAYTKSKRDPFRPASMDNKDLDAPVNKDKNKPQAQPQVQDKRFRTPLERFQLDQLKVVALITGVANPMAVVEDPKNGGHIVRRGTRIGQKGGRVARIYSSGIVITEAFRDVNGKRIVQRVTLRVKSKKQKRTDGWIQVGKQRLQLDEKGRTRYLPVEQDSGDDEL